MTDKDIYLWRITMKPASQDKKSFEFCLQNNILGVGWCLRKEDSTPYTPASMEECERWGREQYDSQRGFVMAIHALKEMAVDDLIWTRHNGVYYLCRVGSTWKYNCDPDHIYEDVVNYVDVEFHKVGTAVAVNQKIREVSKANRSFTDFFVLFRGVITICIYHRFKLRSISTFPLIPLTWPRLVYCQIWKS